MKLAISNIAWSSALEPRAADLLADHGVEGVEVAPTMHWPALGTVEATAADRYRTFWNDRHIRIVAMQAVLYGRPDLTIFESPGQRAATTAYLDRVFELGERLGATVVVFGSPKNRRVGALADDRVEEIACEFFGALGDRAHRRGIVVGIEANPVDYGCDFLTDSTTGIAFVRRLDHPGIGCHLDLGGMIINDEAPSHVITTAGPLAHSHASEPFLHPLGEHPEMHREAGAALRSAGFDGWVSIEMRAADENPLDAASRALSLARDAYDV